MDLKNDFLMSPRGNDEIKGQMSFPKAVAACKRMCMCVCVFIKNLAQYFDPLLHITVN